MTQEQRSHLLELTIQLLNINQNLLELGQEIEDNIIVDAIIKASDSQLEAIQSLQNLL